MSQSEPAYNSQSTQWNMCKNRGQCHIHVQTRKQFTHKHQTDKVVAASKTKNRSCTVHLKFSLTGSQWLLCSIVGHGWKTKGVVVVTALKIHAAFHKALKQTYACEIDLTVLQKCVYYNTIKSLLIIIVLLTLSSPVMPNGYTSKCSGQILV